MTLPLRVLIVDDHPIVREGLRTLLSEEPATVVVGEAANGASALAQAEALQPDVILMDLMMPDMGGVEAIRRLSEVSAASKVLVLTGFGDDRHIRDALEAGAAGFILKDTLKADLLRAIQTTAQGEAALHPRAQRQLLRQIADPETAVHEALTAREFEVLRLIAQGRSNRDISAALHLTEGTVKGYVSTILGKLGVADRTQAALYAIKHRLVSDSERSTVDRSP